MFNILILKTPNNSRAFLLQLKDLHWDFPKTEYTEDNEEKNKAVICSNLTDVCGLMISTDSIELKEVTSVKRVYMLKKDRKCCGKIKLSEEYMGCGWF